MILLDEGMKAALKEVTKPLAKESIIHFQKGFGKEAFTDENGRRKKWKRRVYTVGYKNRKILTKTGRMKRAFSFKTSALKATVTNNAEYSGHHNEGAIQQITKKQLKYFMWRAQTAIREDDREFWENMSRRKVGDTITLPKRQFMGESKPLVNKHKKTILRILKLNTKKSRVNSVVRV